MKNLSNTFTWGAVVLIGILIGVYLSGISNPNPNSETVKDVTVFTDTLVLDNQGEIDVYAVDDGKWLVVSLDDLRYILKKQRKTIVPSLESLFARFEVPDRIKIKPTFK